MTTAAATAAKPRRRWLQFRLRGLLLLMVVVAVPLGWTMNKVREQRDTVAALEKIGYEVGTEDNDFRSEAWSSRWWVNKLLGDDAFRDVDTVFGLPQITDANLEILQGQPKLRWLDLDLTHVTDAGLRHLRGLGKLQILELNGTQVSDAGLVHLRSLIGLEHLFLRGTQVTDAGVKELQNLLPNCHIEY